MAFLNWLESTGYAQWILFGTGWEVMLTAHVIGLAVVLGIVFVLDLRLLGMFKPIPYASFLPFLIMVWLAFFANVISGFSLFMSQATMYVTSFPFLLKIAFVFAGMGSVYYMQKVIKRDAATWQSSGVTPPPGMAIVSLVLWSGALVSARLIAYM
jgi:hypothetical protein